MFGGDLDPPFFLTLPLTVADYKDFPGYTDFVKLARLRVASRVNYKCITKSNRKEA